MNTHVEPTTSTTGPSQAVYEVFRSKRCTIDQSVGSTSRMLIGHDRWSGTPDLHQHLR